DAHVGTHRFRQVVRDFLANQGTGLVVTRRETVLLASLEAGDEADVVACQAGLLVQLAQRGLLEGLARVDASLRELPERALRKPWRHEKETATVCVTVEDDDSCRYIVSVTHSASALGVAAGSGRTLRARSRIRGTCQGTGVA